jgi:hypothetical protein
MSLLVPGLTALAASVDDIVPVRVYDAAGLQPSTATAALTLAATALRPAGVELTWRTCAGAIGSDRCETTPSPGELILRVVRSTPGSDTARTHAARLRSPAGLPLGDAFVDVRSRTGVLATIYFDRVLLLAGESGIDAATLLGHAIAHELGHLLLGSNGHARHGLMRSTWSSDELRRSRPADWTFTREDVEAMRRRREAARVAVHSLRGWE